jgi:cobalamin biosynthesis Co2+ chelatase CbiK
MSRDNEIMRINDNVPITIHVVVESELLVPLDITAGKDAHADMASDGPFGYVAIWSAAMIQKPADASALGSINILLIRRVSILKRKEHRKQRTSSFCNIMK